MISATLLGPARVWLQRGLLDRRLARGADPGTSPELTRRARQLTSRRCRAGLVAGLRSVIEEADEPRRAFSAAVPVRRQEILRERQSLVALAEDLLSEDEFSPRGIALIERLLTDGASPLYTPGPSGDLHRALIHARAALHLA